MMEKIQRFGGAMFTPVLLFSFSGIMVALCIIFKNPMLVGSIANEGTTWYSIWSIVENGAWTVFNDGTTIRYRVIHWASEKGKCSSSDGGIRCLYDL